MKNLKTKEIVLSAVLIMTIAATVVALPLVNAHTPAWTVPTWCFIAITNNPIGVNQNVVLVFWINAVPPTAFGEYGDRWTFNVDVTKPDGSKETLGPYTSDPVGGGWAIYTPTQVGKYTFMAKFVEHKVTGIPAPPGGYAGTLISEATIGDTYSASSSDPLTLTVQQSAIQSWSETPLPMEYWTRPINNANRNWGVLAGNWLGGAAQNVGPTTLFNYGEGPESAHIMWSTPMWAGGTMDARFGDTGYATAHYEGLNFVPPIVLNGKLYYNVQSLPMYGWYCLDLYTGKTEYFHNTTGPITGVGAGGFYGSGSISGQSLSFGQIFNYESPNQHGGMPYLWSVNAPTPNTWMMFDAYSGNYMCSIKNVPSWATPATFFGSMGTNVYGKDGSILYYYIVGTANPTNPFAPATAPFYLQCWNSSRAIWYKPTYGSNEYWMWRPGLNVTYDGNNGFSLNVSLPWSSSAGSIYAVREDQYVIGGTSGKNNGTFVQQGYLWALNLNPTKGAVGSLLWNITFTPPQTVVPDAAAGMFGIGGMGGPKVDPEDGVFLFSESMTRRWWGFSLATGQQLWGPTASEPDMNFYGLYSNIYDGKLLSAGYSGVLICYDVKTGKVLWNYTAQQQGFESPYGNYPIGITCIADGKIYLTSSEHSPTQPLWRGSDLRCVNASNGVELWKILNWGMGMGAGSGAVVADGYVLSLNAYDNQIYSYGKGPSATTVSASPKASVQGSAVLFEGTVIDTAAGTKQTEQAARFPNGVPAMSDASMSAWMEYVYMQQAKPTDATGVKVHLTAIDPNGNFQDLGTAVTNDLGNYAISWKPPVPGVYTVRATFEGSNSYYRSEAGTSFVVSEAGAAPAIVTPTPTATQPPVTPASPTPVQTPVSPSPTQAVTPPTSAEPTTTYIAIGIAVVVIVAAAAALILRRRK